VSQNVKRFAQFDIEDAGSQRYDSEPQTQVGCAADWIGSREPR
jgi:hypothetical protein